MWFVRNLFVKGASFVFRTILDMSFSFLDMSYTSWRTKPLFLRCLFFSLVGSFLGFLGCLWLGSSFLFFLF